MNSDNSPKYTGLIALFEWLLKYEGEDVKFCHICATQCMYVLAINKTVKP